MIKIPSLYYSRTIMSYVLSNNITIMVRCDAAMSQLMNNCWLFLFPARYQLVWFIMGSLHRFGTGLWDVVIITAVCYMSGQVSAMFDNKLDNLKNSSLLFRYNMFVTSVWYRRKRKYKPIWAQIGRELLWPA